MKADRLFQKKRNNATGFNFGRETAEVFGDMLERSVPLYAELQRMIGEIAAEFSQDGTNVYDLGCSTGTTLLNISKAVRKRVRLIGVDYSKAMLKKCRLTLEGHRVSHK